MTEERFDELLKEVREEQASPEDVAGARDRVRQRLTGMSADALCDAFRADLGPYLDEQLGASRRLLLEDHLGRCADCRRALGELKGKPRLAVPPPVTAQRSSWMRWAVAASFLLGALFLGRGRIDRALAAPGPRATVVSVSGDAFRLPQGELAPGVELFEDDVVRTGAGAHAVLELADGSRLEVNQRTELSVEAAWSGQTVRLEYGDVLMQAAKQRRGRLRVVTRDSIASVKGTIFAVSSATSGSLVSVVEGAVEVSQPGLQKTLEPGQQAASTAALSSVGMERALAWSEDAERYYSVLAEIMQIEKDLAAAPGPALRTEPRLLAYLPSDTRAYFAIPNLHGTIQQALLLFDRRAAENEALAAWWSSEQLLRLRDKVDRIQDVAPLLGEEVAFVFAGADGVPALLAEVQSGREGELLEAIQNLTGEDSLSAEVVDGLLLISDSEEHLTVIDASLGGGAASAFAGEIAARYEAGVSWLSAVDAQSLGDEIVEDDDAEEAQALGLPGMAYLFLEQRADGHEATLTFHEARTGMASWLASPGPAGSAEYVSSEAIAAMSASVLDPRQAFDEILAQLGPGSRFAAELAEFEAEAGIDFHRDIADSLGTDVSFAIERPTVPIPGWIVAVETTNPGALDEAARRLVDAFNSHSAALEGDNVELVLTQEAVSGRSWSSISAGGKAVYWTYDRGYLIASMDRALAARAIAVRESGSPLIHASKFRQRFPLTSSVHHSGFFWFDTDGVVAELAGMVQSPALSSLLGSRDPTLILFDGEAERIHAVSRTRLTGLILDTLLAGGLPHAADTEQP